MENLPLTIAPLTDDEAERAVVLSLFRELFLAHVEYHPLYKEELPEALPESTYFVARDQTKVVGFIRGRLTAPVATIFDVFVIPEARGRGVGRALVEHFMTEAKKQGLQHCFTTVDLKNQQALDFWHEQNFTDHQVRMYRSL